MPREGAVMPAPGNVSAEWKIYAAHKAGRCVRSVERWFALPPGVSLTRGAVLSPRFREHYVALAYGPRTVVSPSMPQKG